VTITARDLPDYRKQTIEAILRMSIHPIAMKFLPAKSEDAITMHYVRDIPTAAEPYIAHPYRVLKTSKLRLPTDWVAQTTSPLYSARILNVVAYPGLWFPPDLAFPCINRESMTPG
jgi:hypothetical protein